VGLYQVQRENLLRLRLKKRWNAVGKRLPLKIALKSLRESWLQAKNAVGVDAVGKVKEKAELKLLKAVASAAKREGPETAAGETKKVASLAEKGLKQQVAQKTLVEAPLMKRVATGTATG
tara:strand:+ start:183 stop:542 length:360 start_codon:yes stop_codon:yes gene_type:complete